MMKQNRSLQVKNGVLPMQSGLMWISFGYIIVGLALLICTCLPNSIPLSQICFAVGVLLIAVGAVSILLYFSRKSYQNSGRMGFVAGAIMLLIGIYAVVGNLEFARIFSILIALCILADSVVKMQFGLEFLRTNQKNWWVPMAIGIITAILAMIVLFDPFDPASADRDIFTYSILIADGIANIITVLMVRFQLKKSNNVEV